MEKSVQTEVLKWMLEQVYRAEAHKKRLDERLIRINEERESPIGGKGYSPLPRGKRKADSDGAASFTFKLADIEERIIKQKQEIEDSIGRVMDILDHIPIADVDREIFEMKYIDLMKWREIEEAIPMSKSQCIRRYNAALEKLLADKDIQRMVKKNESGYLAWCVRGKKIKGGNNAGNKTRK